MDLLTQALAGATAPAAASTSASTSASAMATGSPAAARAEVLLVLGGGGVLGAAILARALGCGRFARVQALVAKDLASALPGFEPLPLARLGGPLRADTALIVFERMRRNNGRDEAFVQPQPEQLVALAAQLRSAGVRRLLVVVPHAPALLPQALKAGLATLDEGSVAAMGFEQLLFLRTAQAGVGAVGVAGRGWGQRLAAVWLSQLAWMVPQREQSVLAPRLAELTVELAWLLPQAPPATRVLAPEVLWQAAQHADGGAVLTRWLAGEPLPVLAEAVRRPRY